jgi:hypothetical protein
MFCFFLQLGHCRPSKTQEALVYRGDTSLLQQAWLLEYVLRPQQWLRRRVYEYLRDQAPSITTPCSAIHVRRADVVLHSFNSRKYYEVADYLEKLRDNNQHHDKNILLLTDDANAVTEALEFHPDYNWIYLNRTRHRGKEGGWENQLPSNDPVEEMVVLIATFKLVQQCNTIVHGQSTFSDLLFLQMQQSSHQKVTRLRVDEGVQVFDTKHAASDQELQERLEKRRWEQKQARNDN